MWPAPETLKKIEHEYSLREELDSAWAVRSLALSEHRGQTTLLLEDPGGEPLDRFLPGPMQVPQFLRLAIGVATALSALHKRELIHKDVKPANVLVDPATGQVRLMGFGIASRLSRERQAPEPPEFIAGTLPYMAPEQTGRMNRSIDSRSDLYALGVTLYEMVTGTLPFTASDPIELVHAHIARQPTPARSVPNVVGDRALQYHRRPVHGPAVLRSGGRANPIFHQRSAGPAHASAEPAEHNDPILQQACGGDILLFVAKVMDFTHAGEHGPIVFTQFCEHIEGIDIVRVVKFPIQKLTPNNSPASFLESRPSELPPQRV
jgi:serine/threonine protein kinase